MLPSLQKPVPVDHDSVPDNKASVTAALSDH